MTVGLFINEVGKYLTNLTATSNICTALGGSLVDNKNLFYAKAPSIATPYLALLPYPGGSPDSKDKYNSNCQILIKSKSNYTSLQVGQALINNLHMNQEVCASKHGIVFADQCQPIPLPPTEGGEWQFCAVNISSKHVRL